MIENYFRALLNWCWMNVELWNKQSSAIFKEGEIWWCTIGMTVGKEVFGKGDGFMRPVLIFKKFDADLFLAIPITSKPKEGSWYVPISYEKKNNQAVLIQARALDRKRLVKRMGVLSDDGFAELKQAFLAFYSGQTKTPLDSGAGGKSQI